MSHLKTTNVVSKAYAEAWRDRAEVAEKNLAELRKVGELLSEDYRGERIGRIAAEARVAELEQAIRLSLGERLTAFSAWERLRNVLGPTASVSTPPTREQCPHREVCADHPTCRTKPVVDTRTPTERLVDWVNSPPSGATPTGSTTDG